MDLEIIEYGKPYQIVFSSKKTQINSTGIAPLAPKKYR